MMDAWLFDSDTIVAWPSDVWVIEQKARKQAREDEEEDELLRQVHLPGDTSGVLEQGDVDGTGVAECWGREHILDPSTPSLCCLGSNPISRPTPCGDEQCQVHLPCDTCRFWELGASSEEMGVDDFWGREPDVILDHLLLGGA